MPIDLVGNLALKKKAVEDYLKSPTGVDVGALNYPSYREETLGKPFQDMVASYNQGGFINRRGVNTNPANRYKAQLASEQQSAIDVQNMKLKRDRMTALYNYAMDQYLNSGMDLETAKQYAQQFATDITQQEFEAGQSAEKRDTAQKKVDIAQQYGNVMSGMSVDQGDPYAQAMYRTLFGLLGTGIAGATTGAFKRQQPAQQSFNSNIVGGGNTLREQSGFSPYSYR
jgi:hypothetical protein